MKDLTIDTSNFSLNNRDLKCKKAIEGRMNERLEEARKKILQADRKRIKPCIFELRR